MKRDMDLIRDILLWVEENCDGNSYEDLYDSDLCLTHGQIMLDEHIALAAERELIDANYASNG